MAEGREALLLRLLVHHRDEVVDPRKFLPVDVDRRRGVHLEAIALGDLDLERLLRLRIPQTTLDRLRVEAGLSGQTDDVLGLRVAQLRREDLVVVRLELALVPRADRPEGEPAGAGMEEGAFLNNVHHSE